MNDQTIPAEKVRELAAKYSGDVPTDPHFLLGEIKADLRALLPTPPHPTTGLLGRWAKHEEYGDVVCTWDRPDPEGKMHVRWVDESFPVATGRYYVPLSDLTFPEQATKPEDVTPRTVTTKAEYAALPAGSVVAQPGELDVYAKNDFGGWDRLNTTAAFPSLNLAGSTRTVLRYGGGDEQPSPVWRIEHDWRNLKAGEYVIDCEDDCGVVSEIIEHIVHFEGSGGTSTSKYYAPFIVFPSKDAATPEAIAEAKQARDKETGK